MPYPSLGLAAAGERHLLFNPGIAVIKKRCLISLQLKVPEPIYKYFVLF
jgi:hypothetical protein